MAGPDDWLPLSGIQHFCFCRRQWALIHLGAAVGGEPPHRRRPARPHPLS